ncbi:unconventional prefoldin RPB5 interactor 1 [Entomortierella parvispora]|uniref:Unconventional prefoldin RPB5 interactor 1 n=1 Tax=Entomortierella parvispora TaxID=205924 RepID=A0A9P3H255_9FUNG|nr:unconventional prefoldin RPB5 interactor 1 [Entomortierella parvispora]
MDRDSETAELANYFSKFSAALTRLDEELARWKNYESDYEALKTTLLDLPKETSHSVMVPFGNLAFMPGKLVHTNEVLVMLGDNWFVDRSAVQAAEIVDRRMELVQENITKIKAQEEAIRTKSGVAPGLLGRQEYNEEGLPIVEITEPYFSDDEEGAEKKETPAGLLPFSQKTPEEQAADRAILDRLAELEREDEERERRREAGEIVTSDEETSESEEEDYDDGESEDEHRPKALDSDEEYEEEVWEHSGNESEEDEREEDLSPRKTVRFADQVAKAMKPSQASSSSSTIKTKSPSDIFDQMRSKQQAARNTGSGPMVNMSNLESTFSNLMGTPAAAPRKKPLIVEVDETPALAPEAPALKSSLKPTPKKQSLFKQSKIQEVVEKPLIKEVVQPAAAAQEEIQQPPKKLSKFAMARAAAAAGGSTAPAVQAAASSAPIIAPSAKPAKLGVSDLVFEREVPSVAPTMPGFSHVVERNVTPAVVKETAPPTSSITGFKDVVENTFTKPAPAKDVIENTFTKPSGIPEVGSSSEGRKKSLFRQQQQQPQQQSARRMLPESAFPDSSYGLDEGDEYDVTPVPSISARPPNVVVASSADKGKAPIKPAMKTIPVVASSKLRDTALLKGSVVEREEIESVDEDELEDDMLMRQVVSEYQERRQAMIAQHGAFNREDIERIWEQQVVIPPGMMIPETPIEIVHDMDEDDYEEEDDEEEEEEEAVQETVVDDRNQPPKKLSLFRAARLTGSLSKQE